MCVKICRVDQKNGRIAIFLLRTLDIYVIIAGSLTSHPTSQVCYPSERVSLFQSTLPMYVALSVFVSIIPYFYFSLLTFLLVSTWDASLSVPLCYSEGVRTLSSHE